MSALQLIVGLGNPGKEHEGDRHNVGADFVRALASQQQQILELQSQLRFLHEEMKTHGARLDAVDAPADPPPPHY